MMNMDKVICIGYFVAGYKRNHKQNNDVFLHWQHREKCPEAFLTLFKDQNNHALPLNIQALRTLKPNYRYLTDQSFKYIRTDHLILDNTTCSYKYYHVYQHSHV